MCNIIISQVSGYAPSNIVSNNDLSNIVDTNDEWVFSRTGIKNRRISTGEDTSDLASKVCEGLLKKDGLPPEALDLIIVATSSPDSLVPSTACLVQANVNAVNAIAFDLNAACTGFVYALSVAEKIMRAGPYKTAAVIGADVLSKLVDWSDRNTCCIFGDGAGGVLLKKITGAESFLICEDLKSDGKRASSLVAKKMPVISCWAKKNETQDVQNNYVYMAGRDIFDFALKEAPKNILSALGKSGLSFDDIHLIVPHQANSRIIEAFAKKLKLGLDKFCINIEEYGNTSAASIPLALSCLIVNGKVQLGSGQKLILTGFGGGLTWGSIIIRV
ncbi:MAG: ketoacyl-ACP synthase III [Clostridiales bacterium]|nr:ketoacyl-ACP synthase III [Clostridiales bacterium]